MWILTNETTGKFGGAPGKKGPAWLSTSDGDGTGLAADGNGASLGLCVCGGLILLVNVYLSKGSMIATFSVEPIFVFCFDPSQK